MSTDKQTIDWYNNNAAGYTAHVRKPEESIYHAYYEKPSMYSLVPSIKDKDVLSLGCGSGEDISYLKKLGVKRAVGIDISSGLIEIAKESHPECEFKVMDMEHLDLPDSSFDFVYSSLAIHYIEDWTRIFKEVHRILRPNSYFLFSCGHPVNSAMKVLDTDTRKIKRLERVKNKETGETKVTGDYLNRAKLTDGFGKDSVNAWHKSFGEISSEIATSGFLIEQIVEPRPLEEFKKLSPEKYEALNKIPEFVIFRLIKK